MTKYRCKHWFTVPRLDEAGRTVVNEGDIYIEESEWMNNSERIILTKEGGDKRLHLYVDREHLEFYFEVVEE